MAVNTLIPRMQSEEEVSSPGKINFTVEQIHYDTGKHQQTAIAIRPGYDLNWLQYLYVIVRL